jgi:hypothetical protein
MASKYAALHDDDPAPSKYAALHESDESEPTTRSDAAPVSSAPHDKPAFWQQLLTNLEKHQNEENEKNEAYVAGGLRMPTLGLRQDLGQLGAGLMDKYMFGGSDKPLGELVQRSKPQVEKYYHDIEEKQPVRSAVGAMVGGVPAAAALTPFSAGAGALATATRASPFVAKLLAAGGAGLDAGALSGLLGLGESKATGTEGKLYDAASQAVAGGAMGAAGALAPEAVTSAYQLGKEGLGKAMQVPRAGLDKLSRMLGGAKDAAPAAESSLAGADAVIGRESGRDPSWRNSKIWDDIDASDAALEAKLQAKQGTKPIPENAANEAQKQGFNVGRMSKADADRMWAESRAKAAQPHPDDFGKGGEPPSKDPEFLRKSKELADMLGQGDTGFHEVPPPGPRGPDIKHKGTHRGQSFKFPEDRAGWEREPAAWKAGEDGEIPPVKQALDDLYFGDHEGPDTQAAMEALKRFEMGASKNRFGVGQDSRVAAQPQASAQTADAFAGPPTNAKGGGDLYQPMGAPESAREAAAKELADKTKVMQPKELRTQLNKMGYTSEGNPLYSPQDVDQIAQQVNAQGAQNLAGSPMDSRGGQWFSPSTASSAGAGALITPNAATAMGKERLRNMAGNVGMVSGGYEGLKHGGIFGMAGGGVIGERAALKGFDKVDNWSDKLAEMGQKLLKDPTKLTQFEAQGGQLGKGASFILEGYRTGGEAGMAARAFIISSQPWWREQFADQDEQQP